ncbi:hypothetical protein [Bacillus sp. S/N-304-OC-R1]|uniref:hypothetical protein n=1 Tax=Bacillus sp. S/N-304-OC-R1 TaxID=2758034 RepID=UPI001C8D3CF2|nr:hypothetical protein [Bacillus sp. S/N-304-OC-R1]MBY0121877.1 hypothetical protein [Bacillus sp. S/N-304-OC-R1]
MNKTHIYMLLLSFLLLSGCAANNSWEVEKVSEVNRPILSENVDVSWNVRGRNIQLEIMNENRISIEGFEVNHEKLLHLILVSKDLSYFNHIHPEYRGKGMFEIQNDFPSGGDYRLIADFKPSGGNSMSKMAWVQVDGPKTEAAPVTVDESLEKLVDGHRVQLSTDSLEAGKEVTLTFTVMGEKNNQLISDLQPYLGAIGHVVVLSKDGERYLHVHAAEDQGSGPEALFETEFPSSGIYKVWFQFKRHNQVFTVPYVVNVQ